MKKTILLLLVLLLAPLAHSQWQVGNHNFKPASTACAPFTDPFSGTMGTALNSAWWTNVPVWGLGGGTLVQDSGLLVGNAAFRGGASIETLCAPSLNSYVQFTLTAIDGQNIAVLMDTDSLGNGYTFGWNGTGSVNVGVSKCVTGTCTWQQYLACPANTITGGVYKAVSTKVAGTSATLTLYQNGVLCNGNGPYVDTTSPYLGNYGGLMITPNTSQTGDEVSNVTIVN
jgi:hypothetical protein